MMWLAERFYNWYWKGWYEQSAWDWSNRPLLRRMVGLVVERIESWFDDDALANVVARRFICPAIGHDLELDMCRRPEHRFCVRCNQLAPREESSEIDT